MFSDIFLLASYAVLACGLVVAISYIVYLRRNFRVDSGVLHQQLESARVEVEDLTVNNLPIRSKLDRYATILDDLPNMIVRWEIDGTLTYVNKNYCEDMRTTEEALLGSNFLEWTDEENRRAIVEKLQKLTPENPVQASVHEVVNTEGERLWHQWVDRVIFDSDGNVIEVQSVGTDITSQKLLEQKSIQLQVAHEREQFLQEFLNTITHDLKTPLSVMRSSLYLAGRTPDADKQARYLNQAEAQIVRQEKMINDILDVIRLNHAPKNDWERLSLNIIVTNVITMLKPKANAKEQDLSLYLDPQSTDIFGNSEQIERIVMNLVENALNYTPVGGNVIVSTTSSDSDDCVKLKVKDTGIGIPKKEHDRVFEQFYRATNAQSITGGTGLGLSIVKSVVDRHDGHITIESQPDDGTTFVIQLPFHQKGINSL